MTSKRQLPFEVLFFDPKAGHARVRQGHRHQDVARYDEGRVFSFLKHFGDGAYEADSVVCIDGVRARLGRPLTVQAEMALALAKFYDCHPIAAVAALEQAGTATTPSDFMTPDGLTFAAASPD